MPHVFRLGLILSLVTVILLGNVATAGAQPPTAIVGARVIDGSGNEPFVGTVVIEAGRIRAVGRSVEVPAGAATVDGAGRTVLPGLIDVHFVIAGPGRSGNVKGAMGAALYGGVTSIAVARLTPERYDSVRAEAGRPESGPRAVIAGTVPAAAASGPNAAAEWAKVMRAGIQGILLPADSEGLEAVAADARSRGLRVLIETRDDVAADRLTTLDPHVLVGGARIAGGAAALAQRNVTVAPDLASAAAGRAMPSGSLASELGGGTGPLPSTIPPPDSAASWQDRADGVRALREARVRLAIGSGEHGVRLTPGWSSHVAVRLLVEAGATPLEAVTAATSGGAWALGVQSDRGFLAPGMRADLLVVQGDPSTTIADLDRIDRVYLGGIEVDRPKLLADIRALDAPPPSPTPAVTETTRPAAASAARTATRRRGRDRKAEPATVAPSAPSPADPAPAESATPPATVPATPPTSTTTPAPIEPAPTPAVPSPASPTPSTAAAAPKAGATAIAETAASLDNPLVDDFERGERSELGSTWTTGSSEGGQSATIVMGRVVRGLRDHALHLTARMGDGNAPFVRAAIALSPDGRPVDVSRFRGIRFDARGEGRYRVVFVTRSVADGRYHESYFSGSPIWTPVGIPFTSTGQNGRGGHAPFSGRDLIEIRFEVARDPGQMGWLELDNVRFY